MRLNVVQTYVNGPILGVGEVPRGGSRAACSVLRDMSRDYCVWTVTVVLNTKHETRNTARNTEHVSLPLATRPDTFSRP
jgi:hypothetical protein